MSAQKPVATVPKAWKKESAEDITETLRERLLFSADSNMMANIKNIIPHDFDPLAPGADNNIIRLFNFILKTPEFQLI